MTDAAHYSSLYRIRRVEEELARVYPTDVVKSPIHLSIGQEAISVGLCAALAPGDIAFGTYRGHALYLAKGGNLDAMVAELFGKATGCAGGKGGSMHLIDLAAGLMGTSAVVATGIPNAVGYALGLVLQGSQAIVACVLGDGAAEEGAFHEALNFASLRRLPVLFVCENNDYAIHARQADRQGGNDLVRLAAAYGMPAERCESSDSVAIARHLEPLIASVRAGAGPSFVELPTYRWREHVGPLEDWHYGYREPAEAARWHAQDPLNVVGDRLESALRGRLERSIEDEIERAFARATAAPFPDESALYAHVYKEAP